MHIMNTAQEECRIVHIDDNPRDLELTKLALDEANGHHVVYSGLTDPLRALSGLIDGSIPLPHVVVLDLNMPGMNGLEVLRNLRQDPNFAQVKVIIFTTGDAPHTRERCLALGATAVIGKPQSFHDLIRAAREILDFC
jgi:CheY-like chemotaxis protein